MSMKAINVCWGNYVLIDYTWCKYRFFFFFFSKVSIPRPKYLLLVGDTRALFLFGICQYISKRPALTIQMHEQASLTTFIKVPFNDQTSLCVLISIIWIPTHFILLSNHCLCGILPDPIPGIKPTSFRLLIRSSTNLAKVGL